MPHCVHHAEDIAEFETVQYELIIYLASVHYCARADAKYNLQYSRQQLASTKSRVFFVLIFTPGEFLHVKNYRAITVIEGHS